MAYIQTQFNVQPKSEILYRQALTHASALGYAPPCDTQSNERLEFLGDAVIELICSEFIYRKYPEMQEGDLTRLRSKLVCRASINQWAKELEVDVAMREAIGTLPEAKHLLGNTLEALMGAIYLDLGLEAARHAMRYAILEARVDWQEILTNLIDHKSKLMHWAQKNHHNIQYTTNQVCAKPPRFSCDLIVDGEKCITTIQSTKKEAEMHACRLFLNTLGSDN